MRESKKGTDPKDSNNATWHEQRTKQMLTLADI